MPENKKYLTLDALSRYNKLLKSESWERQNLGCDPIYCNPFYLQSQNIDYHTLSQQFPVKSTPTEEGLPMETDYNLPISIGEESAQYIIKAHTDDTYTLVLDNVFIDISLDSTPESENVPDEPAGTQDDPLILYLGDAIAENEWREFYVNDNISIYFDTSEFTVLAGRYRGVPVGETMNIVINLNNSEFEIQDDRLQSLPVNTMVRVAAAILENNNMAYQMGMLMVRNKDENGISGVYADNRGSIEFTNVNGQREVDFTKYKLDSNSNSEQTHELRVEAHYDIQNKEVVIDNFYCDKLSANTWFEESPSRVSVEFNIEVPDYDDYFTYGSLNGYYFDHPGAEDLEVGVVTDVLTFNYNGTNLWYNWTGPHANFITSQGNILTPGYTASYDLYDCTTSLIPSAQPKDAIIQDAIAIPLMQEGYITAPKFTFNNQAFRFGNQYNIQFLINTPGTTRLDLLTGVEVYDVRNALPSQLYINYDSKSGYQLWYEGKATQLTLDQPQIISKDAVEIYYKLDTTNSTLSFYYNPMDISPESLRYLDDSGSLPVIWYADGERHPYTLIIQDPNDPFQHRTVERGVIYFTNTSATALHFEFIGPNGVIRFSIELQDGQLHQEVDWTSYKFPYAIDSEADNGYSIRYQLCPPPEDNPDDFPPESWPTHKTLQGDWNFMQELIHPRYTVIGAGGACEMNDSNQIINMWGDITIYVYDNPQE